MFLLKIQSINKCLNFLLLQLFFDFLNYLSELCNRVKALRYLKIFLEKVVDKFESFHL